MRENGKKTMTSAAVCSASPGWEKDVEEPEEGDKEEPKKLNFFKRLMRQSDDYKEASRVFRRTVFTNKDWQEFRSSARLWKNISTMFTSGIIRGL
ncbi:hypothetical protein T484DRAFT_1849539, partial [Baffinella frigidus]